MNEFEEDLRRQLSREADSAQGLPRDLSARIAAAVAPRPALWLRLAPVAVALLFIGTLGFLIRPGLHPGGPTSGSPQAAGSSSPSVSISPETSPAPIPSADATATPTSVLGGFICGPGASGGVPTATGNMVALRVAHQAGFDRLTFEFAGTGIPQYTVTPQAGTQFRQDASGMPVDVRGSSGIKVVFHGASERDTNGTPTYQGNNDILLAPAVGSANAVAEVRQIGDFERVLSWAVGLSPATACTRVLQLDSPSRLVIDVRAQP